MTLDRGNANSCQKEPLDNDSRITAQIEELSANRQRLNAGALLRRASQLHGCKCNIDESDPLGRSRMGGMNLHLRLCFEDGTAWLARILRDNYTSFSDDMTNAILQSECATMRWLEQVGIPAPRLHSYGLRNDPTNDVDVAYMLIDELSGSPFSTLDATDEETYKVYEQLADIYCVLARHPMERIGSFVINSDEIQIGPIAGDRTGTLSRIGPFGDASDYYAAWADDYLHKIVDSQIFIDFPVDAYLIFSCLRELAQSGRWSDSRTWDRGPFFLKHMDDKGDHIMVDSDFNITGIIDWSFARVVPAFEAFGPSLVTADMASIYQGSVGLSSDDKLFASILETKSRDLGRFACAPDRVRRLSFALGMGSGVEWKQALELFKGIIATVSDGNETLDWDTWRSQHLILWADDNGLRKLVQFQGCR